MLSTFRTSGPVPARGMAARSVARFLAILPLAFAFLAAPSPAQQEGKTPLIGFLSSTPSDISKGFLEGLKALGYIEGSNLIIEWRWTQGKAARVSELAAELVQLKPDLIVTTSTSPSLAVKAATETIPIVFISAGEPARSGLVTSLARPGGNATGLAALALEGFGGKQIELLQAAVPQASRVAILLNPKNGMARQVAAGLPEIAERLHLTQYCSVKR
ncbi:MAG: ABC transporter substrate-binding protein [Rubrivivax sp.]